jgi:hypothetical protein
VFLTFPTGRLRGRVEKVIIGSGYAAAIGGQLIVMALGGLGPYRLAIVDEPGVAVVVHNVALAVVSAAALAGAVEKCVSSIFGKLGLPATGSESRRVLAVLLFLRN